MKQGIFILIILCLQYTLRSQDNLGIAGSTRSPVNTMLNNPSTIVDSRAFIDINLIGASVFARNTLTYLDPRSLNAAAFDTMTTIPLTKRSGPFSVYGDVMVQGPSATFAVKQHAFGIHTAARVVADVRGIPDEAKTMIQQGFMYQGTMGKLQRLKNVRAHALAWGEAGISYGTILSRDGYAILQGAATVKRLFGAAGAGVRVDEWSYIVHDSTRLESQVFKGEYGFNDPISGGYLTGRGWGVDLGFTYKMRKSNSDDYIPYSPCTDGDYLYRLGVSILDVGNINFKQSFYHNKFDQNESSQWNDYQSSDAEDLAGVDSLINNNFQLVAENSQDGKFKMKLPTAVSAQLDYNLTHNFYVYGVITAGLPRLNSLGVQRASYIGLAPRWETKRFEFSLPLSLYEWKAPQMGFAMRLNSIIIGSDNLGWLLFKQDIYGADFYFSLKYTAFRHWKCKTKSKKQKTVISRGAHDPLPCPTW